MKRLVALDMLRGYALVCIMIDHMPISPLRRFTLANFSIFDAAELFVLLSGFLVGLVWLSVERTEGMRAAQWRFARRAFEVWRALVIGGVIMALLSAWLFAVDMKHTAIWFQYSVWVMENPLGYLGVLATMWLQPNLLDVLAVYVVLLALVPLLVPLLRRWPLSFAAGSLVLWWFAPILNGLVPNHRATGGLLFNPFGWQLLFFSGVAMGLFRKEFMPLLLRHARLLTILSIGMFVFGATIVIASRFGDAALPLRRALKVVYGGKIDKWNLDGTRYLAIMAASWLVAVPLADIMERLANSRLGVALQQIGRGGLWSFVICVLLSILGDAFQMNPPGQDAWQRLMADIWTMVALWWAAAMWLAYGAPRQKAAREARAARRAAKQAAKRG
ncbi:OpgC domain-containing protein [Paracoccus siganidrum]|uniref:OpgC domain-containing protein n=1 Tax=Paracoccus siganidrum TaxID=1276757 RepID=A0A419A9U7_9RHOB|nr:OpgC domain-containing protein [Paracoccus siganidrum]RJL19516.1 OpgC domain-containing protein [Paracoccus siganidrum]RMC32240.1 OpgC domain-containing protein [Paracoccus siganidrum]